MESCTKSLSIRELAKSTKSKLKQNKTFLTFFSFNQTIARIYVRGCCVNVQCVFVIDRKLDTGGGASGAGGGKKGKKGGRRGGGLATYDDVSDDEEAGGPMTEQEKAAYKGGKRRDGALID